MNISRRWSFEKVLAYLILGGTMVLMLATIAEIFFTNGYLANWDAEFYSLSGQYWVRNLLPLGHVAGWFPLWLGGFDYYVMYPPLSGYILGLLSTLIGPALPTRVFSVALWIGLVPAMYNCLRSFKVDRFYAAIGASLIVSIDVVLSAGYTAIFKIGFLPQGLGFLWSIALMGRIYRDLTKGEFEPRRSVLTGILLAGLVLTHHFSALWFGFASLILLVVECTMAPSWKVKAKSYLLTYAVGFALSSFWWVPLILKRRFMVDVTPVFPSLTMVEQLRDVFTAFNPLMLLVFALGAWNLAKAKRWRFLAFIGLTIVYSAFQSLGLIPFPIDVISPIQARRFEAYFQWGFLLFVPFGFQEIFEFMKHGIESTYLRTIGILVLLTGVQFGISRTTLKGMEVDLIMLQNQATCQMPALAHELATRIKPGEANLSEASEYTARLPTYGGPHFLHENVVRLVPGLWDLAGGYPEAISGAEHPFWLSRRLVTNIGRNEAFIRRRGVRYVSTMLAGTESALVKNVRWLKKLWAPAPIYMKDNYDNVALFEVVGFNTPFGLTPELGAKLKSFDYSPPGRYHLTFSEPVEIREGTSFAVNYDPWLHIRLNGEAYPTEVSADKTLALGKMADKITDLSISYDSPAMVNFARFLCFVFWILIIGYVIFGRRLKFS